MTHCIEYPEYQETYEYHGNTAIERTRWQEGGIERDWLLFDTVEEAATYFHEQCI